MFQARERNNRRNESTYLELLLSICSTDDINQYYYFHFQKTVKHYIDFSSVKDIQLIFTGNHFSVENGYYYKEEESSCVIKGNMLGTS